MSSKPHGYKSDEALSNPSWLHQIYIFNAIISLSAISNLIRQRHEKPLLSIKTATWREIHHLSCYNTHIKYVQESKY